jgi:indoleamine 2,3-dioxygenase
MSSYLLEECHKSHLENFEKFGQGRNKVPKNISEPLCYLAKDLGAKPWLDYSRCLIGLNYKRKNKNEGLNYENLENIRLFTKIPDESGFYLTHFLIDCHSA